MARKLNIGQEILDGIRQLKRGEHGRIINVPSVADIREKTGLSQPRFAQASWRLGSHAAGMGAGPARAVWCCADALANRGKEPPGSAQGCLDLRRPACVIPLSTSRPSFGECLHKTGSVPPDDFWDGTTDHAGKVT